MTPSLCPDHAWHFTLLPWLLLPKAFLCTSLPTPQPWVSFSRFTLFLFCDMNQASLPFSPLSSSFSFLRYFPPFIAPTKILKRLLFSKNTQGLTSHLE
jgi:hypothetical protein